MSVVLRTILLGILTVTPITWAFAGSVTVNADQANGTLVVVSQGATIEEILGRMSEQGPFELEVMGDLAHPRTVTGEFRGKIRSVLEQILDHESHVIVSQVGTQEVSRVVLFGRHDGEPAAAAPVASQARVGQPVATPAPAAPAPTPPAAIPSVAPANSAPAHATQQVDKSKQLRDVTAQSQPISRRTAVTAVASRGRP